MSNFQEMGLPNSLVQILEKKNFSVPTPIQEQAIPVALKNKDILGSAQTGTGKTLAFVIPMLTKLMTTPQGTQSTALILVPTRELAQQVTNAIKPLLMPSSNIRMALIIGGEPYFKQIKQLRANPRIIVGTPGRIIDQLERGNISCQHTQFLVLDEADRMLDMGFGIQLEQILKQLPKARQTLMFSATVPKNIERLAREYLNQPERISVGSTTKPFEKIKQEMIRVNESQKYSNLLTQLAQREGSIIIFVKTKSGAEGLAKRLYGENHPVSAIHGDLRQNKRERVIKGFLGQRYRILVATDIAARGLDIPHVQHVINYDLPQCAEDYIHRIGRTARAGAEGFALCMVTPQDQYKWRAISQMINPSAAGEGRSERRSEGPRSNQAKRQRKPYGKTENGSNGGGYDKKRTSSGGRSFKGSPPRRAGAEQGRKGSSDRRGSHS